MTAEQERINKAGWKTWGPYVSDRQWGTVREDYSPNGDAWQYTTHDMARSYAYRWGEEGIAGICDEEQLLCFAVAFWNRKDPILKERFFGLTNAEGNHGEDVKELYYYLDNTPSHSYMKMLYKYPQQEFPYARLVEENKRRTKQEPEFEIMDTSIFDDDNYFDVFIEYAKESEKAVLVKITVCNRGKEDAALHVLPTIWFRNTWAWGYDDDKPQLQSTSPGNIEAHHNHLGRYYLRGEGLPAALFCDNETNIVRLYGDEGNDRYFKDGINAYLVHGCPSINPAQTGTKAAFHYSLAIPAGKQAVLRLTLSQEPKQDFEDFDATFQQRRKEADAFYADVLREEP